MKQVTPRQIYDRWLEALRSGEYTQAHERLRVCEIDPERGIVAGFCCLGVLEDLAVKDGGHEWDTIEGPYSSDEEPRVEVLDFMGLDDDMVYHLVAMNDNEGKTFAEIADEIEFNIMPALGV
jgi:hypothetical protein